MSKKTPVEIIAPRNKLIIYGYFKLGCSLQDLAIMFSVTRQAIYKITSKHNKKSTKQ